MRVSRYLDYPRLFWWRTVIPWRLKQKGLDFAPSTRFLGMPITSIYSSSGITIGARCLLCSVPEYTALGVNHPIILRTMRPDALIQIGEDTGISGATICAATTITIGKRCLLGANVVISDNDFHPLAPTDRRYNNDEDAIASSPITIGDDVFLGLGAIILKGVTIGNGSIIGAGSVVTKDVPKLAIAAGNPARIVRYISDDSA